MELLLYCSPIFCSIVPHVTPTEAGADFEVRPINLRRGDHNTSDLLWLHPKHRVPVLVIIGEPLTENLAVQLRIARRFQQARLLLESYRIADDLLAGGEWFFDAFTARGAYFFWCFPMGRQFDVDVSSFARCLAHFERMQQRSSVQKLLSYEMQVLDAFASAADPSSGEARQCAGGGQDVPEEGGNLWQPH